VHTVTCAASIVRAARHIFRVDRPCVDRPQTESPLPPPRPESHAPPPTPSAASIVRDTLRPVFFPFFSHFFFLFFSLFFSFFLFFFPLFPPYSVLRTPYSDSAPTPTPRPRRRAATTPAPSSPASSTPFLRRSPPPLPRALRYTQTHLSGAPECARYNAPIPFPLRPLCPPLSRKTSQVVTPTFHPFSKFILFSKLRALTFLLHTNHFSCYSRPRDALRRAPSRLEPSTAHTAFRLEPSTPVHCSRENFSPSSTFLHASRSEKFSLRRLRPAPALLPSSQSRDPPPAKKMTSFDVSS